MDPQEATALIPSMTPKNLACSEAGRLTRNLNIPSSSVREAMGFALAGLEDDEEEEDEEEDVDDGPGPAAGVEDAMFVGQKFNGTSTNR
mmetsp:Transcript_47790/g.102424  ORF Transcript_47790/g.102424 Transcript_47790/m.102424 type:complete len:89 (-) Transcript_47790:76-342(-)